MGDFVALDEPLFNLYGGAAGLDDDTLRATVRCGSERTIEQDQAGYNEWADTNGIVVLYPQLDPTEILDNPEGCWDWWGYTGLNFQIQSWATALRHSCHGSEVDEEVDAPVVPCTLR